MRTVALGEVVRIVSGATPRTGMPEYWHGKVQWATPADLSNLVGAYIHQTLRTLTDDGLQSCAATLLPAGSVMLSSRAPIGHVAINTVPMATNQGFKSLVPGPDVDAKYLYHWLTANTAYLQSMGNGATFKELSKKTVEQIAIPLPTLDEQRRITAILDQADGLRAKRRKVLARLEDLNEAMFRATFPETRGETVRLDEVSVISDCPHSTPRWTDTGKACLRTPNLTQGGGTGMTRDTSTKSSSTDARRTAAPGQGTSS